MAGISWSWFAGRAPDEADVVGGVVGEAAGVPAVTEGEVETFFWASSAEMAPAWPRFRVGRSLSAGAWSSCDCDGVAGEGDADAAGAAVGVAVGVGAGALAGAGCVVGAGGASGGLGFSAPARRNTGGPSSSFIPRGVDDTGLFLAAMALMESAVCHLPSAHHIVAPLSSFLCCGAETVNSPRETPVRIPS